MRKVVALSMSLALAGIVLGAGVADSGSSVVTRSDIKAIADVAARDQLTGLSPAGLTPLRKGCRGLSLASATNCSSADLR